MVDQQSEYGDATVPNFSKGLKKETEEPETRTTQEIAEELGEVYFIEKEAKDELGEYRKEFFLAATLEQAAGPLAQKTWQVVGGDESNAREVAQRYNPGWLIVEVQPNKNGFGVVLEEDPNFKGYQIVVAIPKTESGYKVTKTIRSGSVVVDDERLSFEDPELWDEVTEWPYYETIRNLLHNNNVDYDEVDARLAVWYAQSEFKRRLKPLESLSVEQTKRIQPYLYETPKTIALNVAMAKKGELADL